MTPQPPAATAGRPEPDTGGLPRLLTGLTGERMTWAEHRRLHGDLPQSGPTRTGLPSPLLGELARAGLRGRGGGGFPLETKLEAVARGRGTPIVVVNGTEGEPMSVKDRMLLESLPHLVLDGALALADLLGTSDLVIAIDESFTASLDSVESALAERDDIGHGNGASPQLVPIPSGYVTGQETALVNYLNRGIPRPLTQPPRVTDRGVARRATLVSNAETLAHTALIARHGADWFRELGPEDEAGSALVTLSGGVRRPGVYEMEHGSHLGALLEAAGGVSEPARAFLFGGYAGSWVDAASAASLRLSRSGLRRAGTTIGAGIIVVLPQSACAVSEVANVATWMDEQNAAQCGPCVNGLASIADTLHDIREGAARRSAFDDLRRWSTLVLGRGACAHPDGLARFVTTALSVFPREFEDHARHGECDACRRRPVLLTPQRTPVS